MDDWSEIEYLTEKDLPYFRKKAEKGEAVILEIPPCSKTMRQERSWQGMT